MRRFSSGFCAVGPAYDESLLLLEDYNTSKNWARTKQRILHDNVLMKSSEKYRQTLLIYLRKRYFEPTRVLPSTGHLADLIASNVSRAVKTQILYQYTCASDPLIDNLVCEFVAPNIAQYGPFVLSHHSFDEYLSNLARTHPEVKKWSTRTRSRIREEFYRLLRASGVMNEAPDQVVQRFLLRDESFAFLVYGHMMKNNSPRDLITDSLFRRFFLTEIEIEGKLAECEVRGWLQYRNVGGIIELKLRYSNLEDWIDAIQT